MKKIISFFVFVFFVFVSFAQEKIYVDSSNNWVDKELGLKYVIVTKEAKNQFKVESFSLDDKLESIGYYSKFKKKYTDQIKNGAFRLFYLNGIDSVTCVYKDNRLVGQRIMYYPDGKTKLTSFYKKGLLDGPLVQYYPDGKVRRKEKYTESKCMMGALLDADGNSLSFEPYYTQPEFPGGGEALRPLLANIIEYPVSCIENGIQGTVVVQFVIEKDGSSVSARVVESVDPSLDKEALRCVNMIGSLVKWIPAQVEGEPIREEYTLPVAFRLGQEVITTRL